MALSAYGVIAALQPSQEFGRVLAACGGVSLLWGVALDGFHPDRSDLIGAAICLIGVAVIRESALATLPDERIGETVHLALGR